MEFLRARHDRAFLWLDRAAGMGDDPTEAMWIALVSGAARTDTGDYAAALSDLTRSVVLADQGDLTGPGALRGRSSAGCSSCAATSTTPRTC